MSEQEAVDWRPYFSGNVQPADVEYVRKSWLESFYRSPWAGVVPNNLFEEVYTQAIDQLIARGAKILLIRNPANPQLVVAWICYELTPRSEVVVHYTFCKPTYRKHGAVKALLSSVLESAGAEKCFYTFKTANARFFKNCTFRPEIARRRFTRSPA